MIKYCSFGLFFLFSLSLQHAVAQFVENFDDANFTENPSWMGDQDIFIINAASMLQLNDVDVSKSEAYLSVNAPTGLNATWNFNVNLAFSPSGSNFCRIYLNSDQEDLTQALNGYYIQLGGISGDEDAVELVRQQGGTMTTIISGTPGAVATDPVNVGVQVSRDVNGVWNLLVDYAGGQNFVDEGSVLDMDILEGQFFGIVCNYTSSRNDAFSLDDIAISPILVDDTSPALVNVQILSNTQLELTFSEVIDPTTITNGNFQLDNGVEVIGFTADDPPSNILILDLDPALANNIAYTLQVQNIADLAGNILVSETNTFTFFETNTAQLFDLLINEFMADPTPQVGLPNAEYIELFNNSEFNFQLSNYTIASGGSPIGLPDFILTPGAYVLLTSEDEAVNFEIFGAVLGLASFPTLSNVGDEILISDLDGNLIHEISYTLDIYQDADKENGGFSVELINPDQVCKAAANYRASTNLSGGTPAVVNAVLDLTPDVTAPNLLSLFTDDPSIVLLTFDEPLEAFGAEENLNYLLTDNLSVANATLQEDKTQVRLDLSQPITQGEVFGLQFQNISDCLGNSTSLSDTLFFSLPGIAQIGDLLINEILFNPVSGGVDFVEFYNPTDQVFSLADLQIANLSESVNETETVFVEHLILPLTYVCLTEDKSDILNRYPIDDPSTIFETELPPFGDDEGNITLLSFEDNVPTTVDVFDYNEDFHTGFLSDVNGVSLERISFDSPTNMATNWTSAAQSTGFATPGYVNSQVIGNPTINAEEFFEIVNPTFSPDQDGFKDFTQINFTLNQTDYFASMTIYDDEGREIRQLLPFQTVSPSGVVIWDGTDADGMVANMGIYVLYIQLLSPDGDKMTFKEPLVVARRLN